MRRYLLVGVGWGLCLLGLFALYLCILRVIHPFVLSYVLSHLAPYVSMTNELLVALRIAVLVGIYFVTVMLLAVVFLRTTSGVKAKNWFFAVNREILRHQ